MKKTSIVEESTISKFEQPMNGFGYYQENLIPALALKIRNIGTIWSIIGFLQFFAGIGAIAISFNFFCCIDSFMGEDPMFAILFYGGISLLIIGIINLIGSQKNLAYADRIVEKPVNIFSDFQRVGHIIFALIYNMLFGGVIGIIGAIYQLTVRNFVFANRLQLKHIESLFKQYIA